MRRLLLVLALAIGFAGAIIIPSASGADAVWLPPHEISTDAGDYVNVGAGGCGWELGYDESPFGSTNVVWSFGDTKTQAAYVTRNCYVQSKVTYTCPVYFFCQYPSGVYWSNPSYLNDTPTQAIKSTATANFHVYGATFLLVGEYLVQDADPHWETFVWQVTLCENAPC